MSTLGWLLLACLGLLALLVGAGSGVLEDREARRGRNHDLL